MGGVRKAQTPGRKELLGANIAFPLRVELWPLRFPPHRYCGRHKVRIKVVFEAVWVCRKKGDNVRRRTLP